MGTYYYQEALHDLYGPRQPHGVRVEDDGELATENENPQDANALALIVGGRRLGYLSRSHAAKFREAMARVEMDAGRFPVRLLVSGGISTGLERLLQFDVHLDLHQPFFFG